MGFVRCTANQFKHYNLDLTIFSRIYIHFLCKEIIELTNRIVLYVNVHSFFVLIKQIVIHKFKFCFYCSIFLFSYLVRSLWFRLLRIPRDAF